MKKLYEKAIKLWGGKVQLGMLQEECGELISAINRFERGREDSFINLAEEFADVEIVMGQIKHLLFSKTEGKKIYIKEKRRKIKRFRIRLFK